MIIMMIAMIVIYLLGILMCIIMLRWAKNHSGVINGSIKSETFQKSEWFWADKKDIPKWSPPAMAGGAGVLSLALLLGWLFLSQELVLFFACKPYGGVAFSGPVYLLIISLIANLAIAFSISDCYTLLSRRPMSIAHSMLMHKNRKKSVVTRNYLRAALLIWILCYPIRIVVMQSYGTADQDKVIYHVPFHAEVQEYDYETSRLISVDDKTILINEAGDKLRVDNLHGSVMSDDIDIPTYITDAIQKNV